MPRAKDSRTKTAASRKRSSSEVKRDAEALLFSSGKAMEEEQLCGLLECNLRTLRAALRKLADEYRERESALKVFNEGTSWKLLVRDEHIALVRRIVADTELSRATMETLAVIAYRQPEALQSEVVDVRGGNAYEHISELERLGFIVKKKKGRSFSLKLTEKFFEYFDVEGEDSIRRVFREVKTPEPKERQKRLGDLKVINEPREKPAQELGTGEQLGNLEVIDEPEEPEKDGDAEEKDDEDHTLNGFDVPQTAQVEDDNKDRNEFLSKIDAQIDELSKRNDEHAKDETFKRRIPEGETEPDGEAATEEDVPDAQGDSSDEQQHSEE